MESDIKEEFTTEEFIHETFVEYERLRYCWTVHKDKNPLLAAIFKAKTEDLVDAADVVRMELTYRSITGNTGEVKQPKEYTVNY